MKATLPALPGTRVLAVVRLVLLMLCAGVATSTDDVSAALTWAAALVVLALLPGRLLGERGILLLLVALEGLVAGAAVVATGAGDSPFLPYLLAPAFAGGLTAGLLGGALPLGAAAAALLIAPLFSEAAPSLDELSTSTAQWVVLAVLVAGVAAWARSLLANAELPDAHAAQAEAFRLLTELRNVARHLPGTLDPGSSAEAMLARARSVCSYESGAVLVTAPDSSELRLVARAGHERPQWDLELGADSPLTRAWRSQRAVHLTRRLPRTDEPAHPGSALVVPLLADSRTFGLVVLDSGVAQAFPPDAAERIAVQAAELALQLQTALVFDEVRTLATYEERRRLAREIHDGVAQEVASLAYALDNVAADLEPGHPVTEQVDGIRKEVRRVVTELRMSLFDLRSNVQPDEGLGAAISRHVHAVGASSGLTVHLSLNEAPVRLAPETEAELLRIVQEAVANARKHARATNLWVTCTVDPPSALLCVEDDGVGLTTQAGGSRHDSYGIAIMQERAARIKAQLSVEPRDPRGTSMRVTLGKVRM